jgi:hypothetical protein
MVIHRLGHHSGRYDNPKVAQGFTVVRKNCTLATHTEFANDQRYRALDNAAHAAGWGCWQHPERGYDDLAITWDQEHWKRLATEQRKLSNIPTWSTDGQPRAPFCAVAMQLSSIKDGTRWGVITMHTPSYVAVWGGWRPPSSRTKQYDDGIKNLAIWIRELRRKWKNTGLIVAADWNAPLEQPWFRTYLEKTMPTPWKVMAANAKAPAYPDTHDNRCIDWAMHGPKVVKRGNAFTRTVPDSDHKSIFYAVTRVK